MLRVDCQYFVNGAVVQITGGQVDDRALVIKLVSCCVGWECSFHPDTARKCPQLKGD